MRNLFNGKIEEISPYSGVSPDLEFNTERGDEESFFQNLHASAEESLKQPTNFCPNPAKNIKFHHIASGKQLPVPCNKYSCPVCSKKKSKTLFKAIYTWIKDFKYIRMWTLTVSGAIIKDNEKHYAILQEAWRRFITEIRRNKYLNHDQRNIDYVRVSEVHDGKRGKFLDINNLGKIHFHLFVSAYIPVTFLQPIWNHILQELTGVSCKVGNINICGIKSAKKAAGYVTNYVLKSSLLLHSRQKKWTKSGKLAIMKKLKSSGDWILINICLPLEDQCCLCDSSASYIYDCISTSSQKLLKTYDVNCPDLEFFSSDSKKRAEFLRIISE